MKYLSVCSGIEAASVAWSELGWEPVAFSEIEPFPNAVLAHHYPNVPNWEDMLNYGEWPHEKIDVLVGGTPCQSFSVAGLRAGLDDPRGNLLLTFLGIAEKYRPRFILWENVPGVLSVDQGRAFGSLLGALAKLGYGFAYRVLDAQNFGVPQRRRRVFVIACLGSWRGAAAVLFERESLRWDTAPRGKSGQAVAALTSSGVGTCGADDNQAQAGNLIATSIMGDKTHALTGEGFDASEDGTGRGTPIAAFGQNRQSGPVHVSHALNACSSPNGRNDFETETFVVCNGYQDPIISDKALPVGRNNGFENCFCKNALVRRLTPIECERLQGFPDGYTNVSYRGKPACDGPRYKALGNSMAVPVMFWIGQRMAFVNSLFESDGS